MKKLIGLGLGFLFFASGADALDLGVGARLGLSGVGAEVTVGLTQTLNLRFSAASIDIEDESETVTVGDAGFEGDIDATLDFDYGSTALLLDWHVFNGGFRLTGGMMRNDSGADLSGTLLNSIVVDGQPLDPGDINGDIGGSIDLADSYQPYLGVGWGRGAGDGVGLSFMFDVGVVLLDPSADLRATVNAGGNFIDQAELDATLRNLENDVEAELDDLEIWPVLAVGLNFRF